jgi:hypothetical protein
MADALGGTAEKGPKVSSESDSLPNVFPLRVYVAQTRLEESHEWTADNDFEGGGRDLF